MSGETNFDKDLATEPLTVTPEPDPLTNAPIPDALVNAPVPDPTANTTFTFDLIIPPAEDALVPVTETDVAKPASTPALNEGTVEPGENAESLQLEEIKSIEEAPKDPETETSGQLEQVLTTGDKEDDPSNEAIKLAITLSFTVSISTPNSNPIVVIEQKQHGNPATEQAKRPEMIDQASQSNFPSPVAAPKHQFPSSSSSKANSRVFRGNGRKPAPPGRNNNGGGGSSGLMSLDMPNFSQMGFPCPPLSLQSGPLIMNPNNAANERMMGGPSNLQFGPHRNGNNNNNNKRVKHGQQAPRGQFLPRVGQFIHIPGNGNGDGGLGRGLIQTPGPHPSSSGSASSSRPGSGDGQAQVVQSGPEGLGLGLGLDPNAPNPYQPVRDVSRSRRESGSSMSRGSSNREPNQEGRGGEGRNGNGNQGGRRFSRN